MSATVDATDRLTIKVIPSQISISSVGKEGDSFIELENKSTSEVDLSGWTLKAVHSFLIPQGTIILPNQKLRFSSKATTFTIDDVNFVILQNPTGEIATTYPSRVQSHHSLSVARESTSSKLPSPTINLNDLGAAASNNVLATKLPQNIFAWIGLIGVIIIGIVTVLLMRRKNNDSSLGKELRAQDVTIVE
jgi:hypothetical protein